MDGNRIIALLLFVLVASACSAGALAILSHSPAGEAVAELIVREPTPIPTATPVPPPIARAKTDATVVLWRGAAVIGLALGLLCAGAVGVGVCAKAYERLYIARRVPPVRRTTLPRMRPVMLAHDGEWMEIYDPRSGAVLPLALDRAHEFNERQLALLTQGPLDTLAQVVARIVMRPPMQRAPGEDKLIEAYYRRLDEDDERPLLSQ